MSAERASRASETATPSRRSCVRPRSSSSAKRSITPPGSNRLDEAEAEPRGDRLEARSRAVLIEPQPAAEEVAGIEVAQHEIGVGHRRLRAAAPVARGTGLGAGRDRPNTNRAAHVVDPDDRP